MLVPRSMVTVLPEKKTLFAGAAESGRLDLHIYFKVFLLGFFVDMLDFWFSSPFKALHHPHISFSP